MTFLFKDQYSSMNDILKIEALSKEEALIIAIKYLLNDSTAIDEICNSLDIEIKNIDDIKNI